ncbi:hypothetical protein COV49_02375 [Candidatus Falkowbacteria bacterium CG11_big_fil_rev_8_21_14_0_20_39_10]|uniref:Uncharacterized protein n=1 Tax=Candidatus Falkowbacteria bacterium CG11_big_fil_rev_8_21_14_0_20_39_10 TaxID=1974570 RepID=A0A2M6K924_9BACT|nr:MAG: hypothetical protein COV49_02375 [Candidatus Falkowbacteria bacterium CG11_big_fil_rev_8_21_14_0_20_39_10]
MNKFIVKLRIFLWLVLTVVVGSSFWLGIVPSGKIVYISDFEKENEFVQKLTPEERVKPAENGTQKIIGNPVYFSLRTPRKFEKAKLTLKYKNSQNISLLEAGVLVDKQIWRYDLKPIENKVIDDLSMVWDVIRERDTVLLQREKKFNSLGDFLNNLPARDEIALYNYSLDKEFILSDYKKEKELNSKALELSSFSLRGNYQFYTYIKDENLSFNFTFQDLNQNQDADQVDINVYYQNQLIDSRHLDDDGITVDFRGASQARALDLNLASLPEGVYKIEVRAGDDIVSQEIKTSQTKVAFINKIWLLAAGKENFSVFTDSNLVGAQTINPASRQTLKINGEDLEISETYKMFSQKTGMALAEIKLQKDGIILSGDGVFSFSEGSLINPDFKKVTPDLDIDRAQINYILADYRGPSQDGEWKVATAEFDIANAYREFSKNSFIISVPALSAEDDIDDYIKIDEIKVELEGKSLWEKLREVISNK